MTKCDNKNKFRLNLSKKNDRYTQNTSDLNLHIIVKYNFKLLGVSCMKSIEVNLNFNTNKV